MRLARWSSRFLVVVDVAQDIDWLGGAGDDDRVVLGLGVEQVDKIGPAFELSNTVANCKTKRLLAESIAYGLFSVTSSISISTSYHPACRKIKIVVLHQSRWLNISV